MEREVGSLTRQLHFQPSYWLGIIAVVSHRRDIDQVEVLHLFEGIPVGVPVDQRLHVGVCVQYPQQSLRVEQVAIALRAPPGDTILRLQSRADAEKPLVGYQVYSLDAVAGDSDPGSNDSVSLLGTTDRAGKLAVPPGFDLLRIEEADANVVECLEVGADGVVPCASTADENGHGTEVAAIADTVVAARMNRPDGPAASLT